MCYIQLAMLYTVRDLILHVINIYYELKINVFLHLKVHLFLILNFTFEITIIFNS